MHLAQRLEAPHVVDVLQLAQHPREIGACQPKHRGGRQRLA